MPIVTIRGYQFRLRRVPSWLKHAGGGESTPLASLTEREVRGLASDLGNKLRTMVLEQWEKEQS